MAAMLVKNALQLSLRSRSSHLSVRTMSIISTNNFSATSASVVPSSMLMMSTPMNPMKFLDPNHVVINTGVSRQEIGDYLPQVGELFECPTKSLIEPLQAIKRTYQPSVLRRKRKHGFRTRRVSISGRKVLKRRFNKGRWRMSL